MRVSLEWLADFVDIDPSDEALAGRLAGDLPMVGLEVETAGRPGGAAAGFLVAEVLSAGKHPNADNLKLCRVDGGAGEYQVVCGAPNVAAGQRVVLAPPGATLPGGQKVEAVRIRGEMSEGMICSERELGIGEDHSGILVLEGDPAPGTPAADLLGLDDVILDIGITPNRADCLSVLGVAREVAAILGKKLRIPSVEVVEEDEAETGSLCAVGILDPDKCPRYVARVIRGVRVGPSPAWMRRRIRAAGMRPISNIVDVTNYVMLTLGQPLHAFDLDLLAGREIVVRRWKAGDGPFATLDGQERNMTRDDLMICDAGRPVAIGGVMGGANSEIHDASANVLLESAYFAPPTIRRTRRRLGLSSEASYRFERGVDPAGTRRAADWAIELMRRAAGGRIARGAVDAHPAPVRPARVPLRRGRVCALLGKEIGSAEIRRELEALGMEVWEEEEGRFEVSVPAFRPDVEREIDLIEEVARRLGYGGIPSTLPATKFPPAPRSLLKSREAAAREAMVSAGFHEAITYSFVSRAALVRLGRGGEDVVGLQNPLSAEVEVMRTTLLAGLLECVALNLNRGAEEVRLFETGRTFHRNGEGPLPGEVNRIAAVAAEGAAPALWREGPVPGGDPSLPPRLYDLKGALEHIARLLRLPPLAFGPLAGRAPSFDPALGAVVRAGGTGVGWLGMFPRAVSEGLGIHPLLAAFELDMDALAGIEVQPRRFEALPRFPASPRDLAVVIKEEVPHAEAEAVIREGGGGILESVQLFDVYRGGALAERGEKSLAYSLVFRHKDRTLTDEEVNGAFASILARLSERLGGRLRG